MALAPAADGADWLEWRGPQRNGLAPENAPVTEWSPDGHNVAWQRDFGGRNTPVIHDGRVYFNAPVGEGVGRRERMLCLDAATGRTLWERRFNVFLTDIVENRVGWTSPAVDPETGNVYCHATSGELLCWDRDGNELWKKSLTEEFGRISGYGGRLTNPVIDEDRVIISGLTAGWGPQARGAHRYYAFDKRTGDVVWITMIPAPPEDTLYAMPVVATLGGKRMLVCPSADGAVYGLLARTGEIVWSYPFSKRGLNVTPVVDGDRVYVAHSEENHTTTEMGAVACIDGSQSGEITREIWRVNGLGVGYASPALAHDRLYVVTNDANLYALDARDGRVYWEYKLGRVGKGSPVVTADRVIYVGEQTGTFHVLRDEGDQCVNLSRHTFEGPGVAVDEIFGSPAVADGRVIFLTRYHTFCLGAAGAAAAAADADAALPAANNGAAPAGNDSAAADGALQLVPAEVTLRPGDSQRFAMRGSPAGGVTWSVQGPAGQIGQDGTLQVAAEQKYSAGTVTAEVGGRKATALVRVLPELPIELDFDDMAPQSIPPGWIGTGGGPKRKIEAFDLDGQRVLRKPARKEDPSPPFMRLRTYVTPVLAAGYTVQADMMSREVAQNRFVRHKPEMGLVNARYQATLMGSQDPVLRIESWTPLPRIRVDVPFDYEPDVWYTMKFEVRLEPNPDGGRHEGAEASRRHEGTEARRHEGVGSVGVPPARLAADDPSTLRAICRAKVWKRGEPEPQAWTAELIDPYPNTEGSAGLYCYSTGTTHTNDGPETYFDNFKVYRDE